ncbi:hypothetical protein [Pseudomonas panipatensis]|uniref:DNA-binding protein n=1 Tax=Pseudomonas panipatensis TaxID=428992 RepID=A0A1G8JDF6_9PSED|nr:hypothetical protein [Pseudomonas panipatensis]SDI29216.1 hypothetical protein SAMN05216272_107321 [Pseudomonas panipatensis]SMP50990.1 hypothetical protein SAMN06295951_102553 [Pseudomonas panipatensis]
MSTTQEILTEQCGILMTYEQLGEVMHRSPEALRITLSDNRTEWARSINAAKRKWGRRVLFRTADIARLIDEGIID